MKNKDAIEQDFCKVAKVRIEAEGAERYRVFTPFQFEDGDHIAIVLKRDGSRWVLSDEGHTYMRLLSNDDEDERISIHSLQVEDRDGELLIEIKDDQYGDALYLFVQTILQSIFRRGERK